ncbi:MAG: xanthine dehydrogenase family protein subunit M, partial [Myxococcota bacterium]
ALVGRFVDDEALSDLAAAASAAARPIDDMRGTREYRIRVSGVLARRAAAAAAQRAGDSNL